MGNACLLNQIWKCKTQNPLFHAKDKFCEKADNGDWHEWRFANLIDFYSFVSILWNMSGIYFTYQQKQSHEESWEFIAQNPKWYYRNFIAELVADDCETVSWSILSMWKRNYRFVSSSNSRTLLKFTWNILRG